MQMSEMQGLLKSYKVTYIHRDKGEVSSLIVKATSPQSAAAWVINFLIANNCAVGKIIKVEEA